ncbi:MAG TPA: pyroglutamyl-peptidase I [Acetobacteraceae bacterium]|jgi:pyroglutamyl-peptidase|nr:pyroglutamyl-peptidase I [Acetobacteraceae bacterium]
MMIAVLLTGFEPFGGEPVNPSLEAVDALGLTPPADIRLATAILPCSYARTLPTLRRAIAEHRPDAVVCVGQAGGRNDLSIERIAINVDDGRTPDNDGVQRIDSPVIGGGPAAYFATLPIKAMLAAVREGGVPASVSHSAGTFLCNHAMYGALHMAATERPAMRAGFIHVPYLPEQAARHPGACSMAIETLVRGLRAALVTVRDVTTDLRVAAGATH